MLTRKTILRAAVCLGIAMTAVAESRSAPVNQGRNHVAVRGYDMVAYFTEGKPLKGDPKFTHSWQGATWRFASSEHRDAFAASPERYAPQYGGYCAYGVSENHTVDIDPNAWRIVNGKLYLNYSLSVQKLWLADTDGRIRKADQNWPSLHD